MTNSSAVYTMPGTATATAADGMSTSTTTAVFSLTSASFTFDQVVTDPNSTSGSAYADFIASQDYDLYTVSDPGATCSLCSNETRSRDVTLTDLETHEIIYDTFLGGSSSGVLTIGDEYQFSGSASVTTLTTDPTFTYLPSLTLTSDLTSVPENPAPLVPAILCAFAILRRRMRWFAK